MTFKEKAISALEELKGDSTGIIAATIEDCQRVIGDIPEDSGWVPVTERLPEEHQCVVAVCKNGKIFVGYHWRYGPEVYWCIVTARNSTKRITQIVTHWMPLHEPPKEDA